MHGMPRALLRMSVLGGAITCGPVVAAHADRSQHAQLATMPKRFRELDEQTAQLKMIQVVFRHGARTPLTKQKELWQRTGANWDVCGCAYQAVPVQLQTVTGHDAPSNVHDMKQVSNKYEGGCHMGQLTEAGQLQARDLGRWLRQRYVHQLRLLPETYQAGMLAARTTNFQRTVATLAGVMTGLLGEPANLSQPIPVVTSGELDEILYADSKQCPHLSVYMKMGKEQARSLIMSDPEYSWVCSELKRLGFMAHDEPHAAEWFFADLHDVVTALAAAGKPIPEGFTPQLVMALNRLATKEFAPLIAPNVRDSRGHIVLQLSMGVLLHTLVENMQNAVNSSNGSQAANGQPHPQNGNGTNGPLIFLYSGHDRLHCDSLLRSTIMPLLSALGLDVLQSWPPFLSNLVFELWQLPEQQSGQGPQHVVRVLYNQSELSYPHCPQGLHATLDTFKSEVIGPFLISQQAIADACKVPVEHDTSMPEIAGSMSSFGGAASDEKQ